ncbi:hypothetical protein PV325_010737 [Microctonus aethiopoides]|nr:hypothetical protein PV325_010737 [Microctonus aethiopoides]KAK0072951.1 hypothetical protein PV326_013947 [Microctonus aethiopoides]
MIVTKLKRCKQALVRDRRKCSECQREFHPSSSKIYLSYTGANTCCFVKLSPMRSSVLRSSGSVSSIIIASSSTSTTMSSSPRVASESTLNAFIEQQSLFNNNLSEMMRKLNNELNGIKTISKSVADHQIRIKKLEQQNAVLNRNVVELGANTDTISNNLNAYQRDIHTTASLPSSEVIISGIPPQVTFDHHEIAVKVLTALYAPQLNKELLTRRLVV